MLIPDILEESVVLGVEDTEECGAIRVSVARQLGQPTERIVVLFHGPPAFD